MEKMTTQPTRTGIRFSLRSLMIVVAIAACCLGYELNAVRQRKVALQEFRKSYAAYVVTAEEHESRKLVGPSTKIAKPWLLRRLMGDEAIQEITFYTNMGTYDPAAKARAKWMFPEANVLEVERLMEPCHPGCFPKGTLVETPTGQRKIEAIAVGDPVVSVRADGSLEMLNVQSIFKTENRLWIVETDLGSLTTTETQPLRMTDGSTKGVGDLIAGDIVLRFDGGQIFEATVRSATKTDRITQVINLVLGDRQAFVAGGFVVRSKPASDH
jgi:hypothetical protein